MAETELAVALASGGFSWSSFFSFSCSSLAAVASRTCRGDRGEGWCSALRALSAGELGADAFFSISLEKLTKSVLDGRDEDELDRERLRSLYCRNSLSTDSRYEKMAEGETAVQGSQLVQDLQKGTWDTRDGGRQIERLNLLRTTNDG